MKMKMICFLLAAALFALLFAAGYSDAYANEDKDPYFSVMVDFGFVSGEASQNQEMTRGEFCDIIAKAADLPKYSSKNIYSDVPESYKYAESVYTLTEMGYISGDGDGKFNPEECINFEAAAKIIAKVNGFDVLAEAMGEFPAGYRQYALKYHISDGISEYENLSRSSAVRMVYNMLVSEYMSVKSKDLLKSSGRSMLEDVHNIKRYKGIVYSTGQTALNGENVCRNGQIALKTDCGNIIMNIADEDGGEKYLGRNVTVYAQNSDGEYNARSVKSDAKEQKIDISAINKAYKTGIEYYNGADKLKTVNISEYGDYIYNGKADLKFKISDINSLNMGDISLIDNNDDGIFEVVIIFDYKNFILDAKDAEKRLLFDMDYNQLPVGEAYENGDFQIIFDGQSLSLNDLKRWDVISYIQSRDKTYMKLYVSRKNLRCDISSLSDKNGEHIIGVDNKKYKTAKECYNEEKIKPGAWGVLYLDFFGNAAAFDVKSNDNVYGYLIGISEENKLSPDVKFKIFTQNGEEEILESAKKIIYNEENAYTGKEIYEKIKLFGGGSVLPQLVRYDYTEGGKLTKISVAQNVSDENKFRTGGILSSAQCTNNSNVTSFASKYIMSPSTVAFCVPKVINGYADTSVLRVIDAAYFENTLTYNNLEFYDVDETKTVGLLAYVVSDDVKKLENKIFCVENVGNALNSKGEKKNKLKCVSGSIESEYFAEDEILNNPRIYNSSETRSVKSGDLVRLAFNSKNEISDVVIYASCAEENSSQYEISLDKTNSAMNSSIVICSGVLADAGDDAFTVGVNGNLSEYIYPLNSSTKFFVYNSRNKNFENVSREYFASKSGKKIFVHKRFDVVMTVVILEEE